jgi:hypothetical protein
MLNHFSLLNCAVSRDQLPQWYVYAKYDCIFLMQLPVAHAHAITSDDVISGDDPLVDPPQMISGWGFYTTNAIDK